MRVLILGYRNYELNIFKHSQPEVTVLKKFLRHKIVQYLEEGAEWFILQNQPGIDMYAGEVLLELKKEGEYDFKYIILKPFLEYDERFKDEDKLILNQIEQRSEFSSYIFNRKYEDPSMFRAINSFLVQNSTDALILYDDAQESNLKYIYNLLLEYSTKNTYNIERIQFDEINDFINSDF